MKKILWFAFGCFLVVGLVQMVRNSWQIAEFFRENGRTASLKIGPKYNASHWSSPLPLKRVHSYVAVLAPDHEVVIETAQSLKENETYFIRFLLRDNAEAARERSIRPLVESVRLRAEADGTPVRLKDTNLFDRVVEKAMGPPGPDVYVRPNAVAEAPLSREKPTVPFMISGEKDGSFATVWQNTTFAEWLILLAWVFAIKMVMLQAWVMPWSGDPAGTIKRKNRVHPTLRQIEPDARPERTPKLTYVPRGDDPAFVRPGTVMPPAPAPFASAETPAPPPPRATVALPATAKSPTEPRRVPSEPYSTATTAPFIPAGGTAGATEPTLRLARKPKPPSQPPGADETGPS